MDQGDAKTNIITVQFSTNNTLLDFMLLLGVNDRIGRVKMI